MAWSDDEIKNEQEEIERHLVREELLAEEYLPEDGSLLEESEEEETEGREEDTAVRERKKLKRELEAEALKRLEDAARTEKDFRNVVSWWDRLDANRERKERYHEIARSGDDLPIDFGAAEDGLCFPASLNGMLMRQIRMGDFIEAIFFCPLEIQELVTEGYMYHILNPLKEEQKELLFQRAIQKMSTLQIGQVRGQTDRNIRKVWNTLLKKLRKELAAARRGRQAAGLSMTLEEKAFLEGENTP